MNDNRRSASEIPRPSWRPLLAIFAAASLSFQLCAGLSAAEPSFYRAVNLGGDAVTIGGNHWEGDRAKNLKCSDRRLVIKKPLNLKPETDKARSEMLFSFRWNRRAHVQFTNVPDGVYTVWVYIVEDNNPETFDISLEGLPAVRGFNSGPEGTWKKVGPLVARIDDRTIDLQTRGGAANLCGVEIWKGAPQDMEPLQPPQPPVSPFLGKFADQKPRVVVMTDIGGDPDDRQSLVRYLLYSCDIETEGFCTGFGHGHYKVTHPELIHKAIDAYGRAVPNLRKHRKEYPTAQSLKALVKDGSNGDPHRAGPGQNSEASDWIIKVLERNDPRPVWFSIWGGPRELAQALWKMQQTKPPEEFKRLKAKIRVHSIADQDRTAGWIKKNHPDVFYLYSRKLFRGIWKYGNQNIVSPGWLKQHVSTGHGPLGAPEIYPPNASGKKGVKEGDTPSYLWVLRNGLSDPEAPTWGNWGGRFRYSGTGSEFVPGEDMFDGKPDMYYTIWRWRTAYQNEFQARMDWCIKPYDWANHRPVAICNGQEGTATVHIHAKPGERVILSAAGCTDPDKNQLGFRWWVYEEAGSYTGKVALGDSAAAGASLVAPKDAGGKTIHVILEVTDDGDPPLTAYRRGIIQVKP